MIHVGISWVPWGTQITEDFSPHGTEHPPRYSWYPPTCIMISPTVLKITSPTVLKITPPVLIISPTVLNTPTKLKISPTVLKISPQGTHDIPPRYRTPPTVLNTPHGTEHPHGTAQTLYRVIFSVIVYWSTFQLLGGEFYPVINRVLQAVKS